MDVRFRGFRLLPGDGITKPEFTNLLLAGSSPTTYRKFDGHNRIFLFEGTSDPEFFTGLLVSIKDHRKLTELRDESGKLKIKVNELAKGSQLMDFNFFVLHEKSFCGLYQHYHQSCSGSRFGAFLRAIFWNPERALRIAAETKKFVAAGEKPDSAEKLAKKAFYKTLNFQYFVRPENFSKIMDGMSAIKAFIYDVGTKEANEDGFVPHGPNLKSVSRKVVFANQTQVKQITKSVKEFVEKFKPRRGTVVTADADDEIVSINIIDNLDDFGEFDFDEVASEIELDLDAFTSSWLTKRLLEAANANKALLSK